MRAAVAVLASVAALAVPTAPSELQPPKLTRQAMEATPAGEPPIIVYGTRDSLATPMLQERATWIARRWLHADSSRVVADRVLALERARGTLILVGGARENSWTARLAPGLPLTFTARGFRWQQTAYERPGDAIHLTYPNPLDPRRFVLVVAANSPAALSGRGAGLWFGVEDWRIDRDGELARSGRFAQSLERPWRYDPSLDHDREADREAFVRTLGLREGGTIRVRSAAELGTLAEATMRNGRSLLTRLDALGFRSASPRPITVTLYRSLEEKGRIARNTRPEHLDAEGGVHVAMPAGRTTLDLVAVAAARLRTLGAAPEAPYLEPASVAFVESFEGEPLAVAVSRLYFGRMLPRAREAARSDDHWRSPLIWVPARALLARAIYDVARPRSAPAAIAILGASPPSDLDSLCRIAGVPPARVEARYSALADSFARAGAAGVRAHTPAAWRPRDGFQRGVCLAHSVRLEGGYLSTSCAQELERLERYGVSWISITPFGYLPSPDTPEIWPSAGGGAEEESDEAIAEAAARAREHRMRVWLTPHLWTRGWVGQLNFSATDWPRFFDRYREFILHYALLAQRERIDGLVIGHELMSASLRDPDRWRALIAEVRRVYTGTLTYGANWGEEVKKIAFWDALDLVGVSFYEPLATRPTRSPAELEAGARRALEELHAVGARVQRPVLLLEVGYPSVADAAERPWEEGPGATDPEMQRLCYQALTRALEPHTWIAGAFFWKWYSDSRSGDPADRSYTPQGKPAEAVMAAAMKSWIGRPVETPRLKSSAAPP
jgi:Glycoside Hydrolase Family 113